MTEMNPELEKALTDNEARWAQMEKEEEAKRRLTTLTTMGYMPEYADWNFKDYQVDMKNGAAFDACLAFSNKPYNLLLHGLPGNGKSRLAWAAMHKYWREKSTALSPKSCLFLPIHDFNYKATENTRNLVKELLRKDVLVLDDLGAKGLTDAGVDALVDLLNKWRGYNKQGLIITCNYTLKELSGMLNNDRIPSRISGLIKMRVENKGDDYRTKDLKTKTIATSQDFKARAASLGVVK